MNEDKYRKWGQESFDENYKYMQDYNILEEQALLLLKEAFEWYKEGDYESYRRSLSCSKLIINVLEKRNRKK